MPTNLAQIKRLPVEEVLANLLSEARGDSMTAGETLVARAKDANLSMRDYLTLVVDPRQTKNADLKAQAMEAGLDGYQLAKLALNLPVKDDFESGVLLQAASDTFQSFPGTRALFPEVIDDMVSWQYRQNQLETVAPMLVQSRTISGVEMISTVVTDKAADYDIAGAIPEGSNIPVNSIRTSQHSVGIFKHGMGYRTTYEFERRARLDILTPYANRAQRAMELSRVKFATNLLINGHSFTTGQSAPDASLYGAAPEVAQSSYATSTAGTLNYRAILGWLVDRAKNWVPIDTVVGNYDAYLQWVLLFALPLGAAGTGASGSEVLAKTGFQFGGVDLFRGAVNFVISSAAPAGKLIGFSRSDTMEELVEAGSLINESDRSVRNQTITYYRTMNTGYRLIHGDTRSVYNYNA